MKLSLFHLAYLLAYSFSTVWLFIVTALKKIFAFYQDTRQFPFNFRRYLMWNALINENGFS